MFTSYNTFSAAISCIEQLHSEGVVSFKLYRQDGFWFIEVKV